MFIGLNALFFSGSCFYFFLFFFLFVSVWVSLSVLVYWVFFSLFWDFVCSFFVYMCIWFLFFSFIFPLYPSYIFSFFVLSFLFFLYLFISLSPVVYGLWSLGVIVKGQACTSKWKTQAQDIGAAENFQPHGILMCDSSPKGLYLNTKMRSHPKSSKLQCRCFMLNH